jgi:putative ABC transport system ATP-binding protein
MGSSSGASIGLTSADRVALAGLLADEPTGNLDSVTGDEIADLLASLNREGRTVVVVTHNEVLARRAQRVVRLKDGRIDSEQEQGP